MGLGSIILANIFELAPRAVPSKAPLIREHLIDSHITSCALTETHVRPDQDILHISATGGRGRTAGGSSYLGSYST